VQKIEAFFSGRGAAHPMTCRGSCGAAAWRPLAGYCTPGLGLIPSPGRPPTELYSGISILASQSWREFPFRTRAGVKPGFPFWHPGRYRLYIQPPPWERFLSSFPTRATPAAQEGPSSGSSGYGRNRKGLISSGLSYTSPSPVLPSACSLARRRPRSGRQGQRGDPPHHRPRQRPRHMALRQKQPVIAGMFD